VKGFYFHTEELELLLSSNFMAGILWPTGMIRDWPSPGQRNCGRYLAWAQGGLRDENARASF
jgi:hypothetical protein